MKNILEVRDEPRSRMAESDNFAAVTKEEVGMNPFDDKWHDRWIKFMIGVAVCILIFKALAFVGLVWFLGDLLRRIVS